MKLLEGRIFVASLLLLAFSLFASTVSAVSSEQAKEVAKPYLEGPGEAVVVARTPVEYGSGFFWLVYFTPQDDPSSKNIIFVIEDENGVIEVREDYLRGLYAFDYHAGLLGFLKDRKISYNDLKAVADVSREKIRRNARGGLDSLQSQSSKYPQLSFEDVERSLEKLETESDSAADAVEEAGSQERDFDSTQSSQSLKAALAAYPGAWDAMEAYAKQASEFQKALSEKQVEVLKSDVQDSNSIYKSLEAMKDVGIDDSYNTLLSSRRAEFEQRKARTDSAVNDTLSSFRFRKARVDARNAFSAASQKVEALIGTQYSQEMAACGLKNKELKSKWESIRLIVYSASSTTEKFESVPSQVNSAVRDAEKLEADLTRCLKGSPTPKPKEFSLQDYANPALMVAFLGIVVYGVYRFKKQQDALGSREEY